MRWLVAEGEDPQGDTAATPRWLVVTGSLVILAAVAFVVMHLVSGGLVRH